MVSFLLKGAMLTMSMIVPVVLMLVFVALICCVRSMQFLVVIMIMIVLMLVFVALIL